MAPDPRERIATELDELVQSGRDIVAKEMAAGKRARGVAVGRYSNAAPPEEGYPEFSEHYQLWYTKALPVVRQLLSDREEEFVALYAGGRHSTGPISLHIGTRDDGNDVFAQERVQGFERAMRQQVQMLMAARERLDSVLADIRGVLEAALFDSELEVARELLKKKHVRPAGAVAGVVLEKHLKDVAANNGVKLRKAKPTINDLNEALKAAGVYDLPPFRRIQLLGDIRNLCSHDSDRDPTAEEVDDLIRGVDGIVKSVF